MTDTTRIRTEKMHSTSESQFVSLRAEVYINVAPSKDVCYCNQNYN